MDEQDLTSIRNLLLEPILTQLSEIKADIQRLYDISKDFQKIDTKIASINSEKKICQNSNAATFEEIDRLIAHNANRIGKLENAGEKRLKNWHLWVGILSGISALIISVISIFRGLK